MRFPSAFGAQQRVLPRLAGGIAGLVTLCSVVSGIAYADTDQGSGSNHSDSRQSQARSNGQARPDKKPKPESAADNGHDRTALDAVKAQADMREQVEDIAAFAAAAQAAAVPADLEIPANPAMSTAAQQAALGPGGPVPTVGMGGLVPNARALAAYVAATYPGVQAIGGVRSDPLPDHPSGHAIDIMIGSDMGLGDAINADVQSQTGRFGVSYTLWRVPNHFNHVHVTVF